MEGYFPVSKYCELTGLSHDTAYHRAERGATEAFKNEDGRWFIYFTDEDIYNIPEGFVPLSVYCKLHHIHQQTCKNAVRNKAFQEEDYRYVKMRKKTGRMFDYIFIRQDVEYPNLSKFVNKRTSESRMNECRPMGYLTVSEWANREGKSVPQVYYMIRKKAIPSCLNFGHHYIHHSVTQS